MKELYAVKNTEQEAQNYQDEVFPLILKGVSKDGMLIRDSDKKIVRITSLTDKQLNSGYVVYGYNKGIRQLEKGKTVRWDIPRQRKDGKWTVKFNELVPSGTEEYKDTWFNA